MNLKDFGPNVPIRGFEAKMGFHLVNLHPSKHKLKNEELLKNLGIKIVETSDPLVEEELVKAFASRPENDPSQDRKKILKQRKVNSLRKKIINEINAGRIFVASLLQRQISELIFS